MSSFIVKKSPFDIISERVLQSIEQIIEEGGKPEWFKPWTFGIGEGLVRCGKHAGTRSKKKRAPAWACSVFCHLPPFSNQHIFKFSN